MSVAEREAQKAVRRLADRIRPWFNVARMTDQQARPLVGRLRYAILKELDAAYSRGYAAGHEDQMQMRIRDKQEREAKP